MYTTQLKELDIHTSWWIRISESEGIKEALKPMKLKLAVLKNAGAQTSDILRHKEKAKTADAVNKSYTGVLIRVIILWMFSLTLGLMPPVSNIHSLDRPAGKFWKDSISFTSIQKTTLKGCENNLISYLA